MIQRIGLLSDSHGQIVTTRHAVARLREQGIDLMIHLGDFESDAILDELVPGPDDPPVRLTLGNVDRDHAGQRIRYATHLGLTIDPIMGQVDLPGDRLVLFTHGDDPTCWLEAKNRQAAYFCHGHTHRRTDRLDGTTRVINPGALFRCDKPTVAILDLADDSLTFLDVELG